MAEVLYREEGGRHFVSVQEGMISVTGPTIRANKRDITDRDLVRIAFAFEDPTLVELRMYRDVSTTPDTFSNRFEFALHRDEHRRQDLRDYLAKKLKWFESFVFDDLVQAKAFQDRCERDIVWRELKGEPEPIVDVWTHVTYTRNGNNQVIQHSLGFPPKMIITKTINGIGNWQVDLADEMKENLITSNAQLESIPKSKAWTFSCWVKKK